MLLLDIVSFDITKTFTDMPDNRRGSHDTPQAGFARAAVQEPLHPKSKISSAKMQFSVTLISLLASLAMAAPGNSPAPDSIHLDLPALNDGLGYMISPELKPETDQTIVKRREGCVACQW
ncbi:uncharacterized protein PODANS_1_17275 [Podospora anserina S mat+]|uniref:Podospora anserina S mat+ genomic DNA chromosome 1, supercontig 4 n=1 Tax=Podospora anserina (strain S / ATCC MYA-4624 / DSM 980 / FGSC 10383) TaxID=515849 RepID=B2ATX5_PODAN|nr:uncharacterized protein PODANS_1_17275 [Podospora anserina S mat+]CAP67848.1 unnamed protein product [Podospora anserina S mat+]CDP24107.1 Putative protein of unknown function [Podospora anserina S mat+]